MMILNRPVTDMMNRLLSCGVFAAGLFACRWEAPVLLLGFWLEEVIAFLFIAFKRRAVRKRMAAEGKRMTKGEMQSAKVGPFVYFAFPAVHLIFVLTFIGIESRKSEAAYGLLSTLWGLVTHNPGRVDSGIAYSLLALVAAFAVTGTIQAVKDLGYGSAGRRSTLRSLDAQNRSVLVMPHITIIFGGFAMLMFNAADWMAWGLVGGKCICELLLVPRMQAEEEKLEEKKRVNEI